MPPKKHKKPLKLQRTPVHSSLLISENDILLKPWKNRNAMFFNRNVSEDNIDRCMQKVEKTVFAERFCQRFLKNCSGSHEYNSTYVKMQLTHFSFTSLILFKGHILTIEIICISKQSWFEGHTREKKQFYNSCDI